jgi:hypothetical protein
MFVAMLSVICNIVLEVRKAQIDKERKKEGILKNLVEGSLVDSSAVKGGGKKADNHNRNENNEKTQPTAKYPDHRNSIQDETQGGRRRNKLSLTYGGIDGVREEYLLYGVLMVMYMAVSPTQIYKN